jgi:hypothetical protein
LGDVLLESAWVTSSRYVRGLYPCQNNTSLENEQSMKLSQCTSLYSESYYSGDATCHTKIASSLDEDAWRDGDGANRDRLARDNMRSFA